MGHPILEQLSEVGSRRNGVDIHEDIFARRLLRESLMNHPRLIFAVMAAVADENAHMKFLISSPGKPVAGTLIIPSVSAGNRRVCS